MTGQPIATNAPGSNISRGSASGGSPSIAGGIASAIPVLTSAANFGLSIAHLVYLDRTFDAERELRRLERRNADSNFIFDAVSRRNTEIARATSRGFTTSFGSLAVGARAATRLNQQRGVARQREVLQTLQEEQRRIAAITNIVTSGLDLVGDVAQVASGFGL